MIRFVRPLIAAFFLAAMAAPVGAVVATTSVACVTAWTDLGAGPMTVQASSSCVIAIADATPGVSLVGFHLNAAGPFAYAGSSHLWARGSGSVVIAK